MADRQDVEEILLARRTDWRGGRGQPSRDSPTAFPTLMSIILDIDAMPPAAPHERINQHFLYTWPSGCLRTVQAGEKVKFLVPLRHQTLIDFQNSSTDTLSNKLIMQAGKRRARRLQCKATANIMLSIVCRLREHTTADSRQTQTRCLNLRVAKACNSRANKHPAVVGI